MSFCDLATGKIEPHVNSTNLHHLYNPSWAKNGKWIISTVHAGMGFDHAILLIEARGTNIINLKIPAAGLVSARMGSRLPGERGTTKSPPRRLTSMPIARRG